MTASDSHPVREFVAGVAMGAPVDQRLIARLPATAEQRDTIAEAATQIAAAHGEGCYGDARALAGECWAEVRDQLDDPIEEDDTDTLGPRELADRVLGRRGYR